MDTLLISSLNSCMIRNRVMDIVVLRRVFAFFLSALLISLLLPFPGFAEEGGFKALSDEELQELVESYSAEKGVNPDLISVGYVYTETGERWFYNGDHAYYSASLYKVPLMMLFAEQEAEGELTQESEIYGMTLDYIEDEVLISSNNPIAYSMMCYLGEPSAVRAMFQRYSELPEDYYTWDFCAYSYFTAHFMTDVMETLYLHEERFPHILEKLKQAQPGHFFRMGLGDEEYEIAQKYGSYHDDSDNDWNHTAGVIYTKHPFVLTVMTRYGGMSENIISDLAVLMKDYTLKADQRLEEHLAKETAEQERLQREAEEKAKAETPEPTAAPAQSAVPTEVPVPAEPVPAFPIPGEIWFPVIAGALLFGLVLCIIRRKR